MCRSVIIDNSRRSICLSLKKHELHWNKHYTKRRNESRVVEPINPFVPGWRSGRTRRRERSDSRRIGTSVLRSLFRNTRRFVGKHDRHGQHWSRFRSNDAKRDGRFAFGRLSFQRGNARTKDRCVCTTVWLKRRTKVIGLVELNSSVHVTASRNVVIIFILSCTKRCRN